MKQKRSSRYFLWIILAVLVLLQAAIAAYVYRHIME